MADYKVIMPHVSEFFVERRMQTVRNRFADGDIARAIVVLTGTLDVIARRTSSDMNAKVLEAVIDSMEMCHLLLLCDVINGAKAELNNAQVALTYKTPLTMPAYMLRRRLHNEEDTGILSVLPKDIQWHIGNMLVQEF